MKQKLFILLVAIIFSGCYSENTQKDDISIEPKKDKSPTYTEMVWRDYNEILEILSLKYNIDSSKVKPLIIEYIRVHDPITYFSLTMDYEDKDTTVLDNLLKPQENVNSTLQRLSIQFLIDDATLSSFIYDFRVYSKLLEIEEKCNRY